MNMASPLNTEQQAPSIEDETQLARLVALQGTDPGLFVLAVHSYIEAWLRVRIPVEGYEEDNFYYLVDRYKEYAMKRTGGWVRGYSVFSDLKQAHKPTNEVRHRFACLGAESARTATQHLRRFCQIANIPATLPLEKLEAYLKVWDDRKPLGEMGEELKLLKAKLCTTLEETRCQAEKLAALDKAEEEAKHLSEQLRLRDAQITELENTKNAKDARVDELRKERGALVEELRQLKKQEASHEEARAYLEALSSLSLYTRTRADYEKTLVRLTGEQKRVLEQIRLDADFLVKGAAGTGKTLVLLKAIEKAKGAGLQAELGLKELDGSLVLLTYTTTLVKYDRYISSIMWQGSGQDRVLTADSFLLERLSAIDPGARMDYDIARQLAERYAPENIDAKELAIELEEFIWANDVDYQEYVEKMMDRRGMKRPIGQEERKKIWMAAEAISAEMIASKRYSKSFSRIRLLRHAEAEPNDPRLRCVDYVFVDEAQDLCAVDLKALKLCSRKALILAGDSDQSIYQPGFSFKRAGLDVSGRSRILKTNFRNTIAIHDAAERYRATFPGPDGENSPEAFREGPTPELFVGQDRTELLDLLSARVELLIKRLGYEPENICVLAPLKDDVDLVAERLSGIGYHAQRIYDKDFEFTGGGAVRISTLHSAKGLDFPVVLLFLYRPPYVGSGRDEPTVDRMTRNLVYVAMTRAMDHLGVFVTADPKSAAIKDLVASLKKQ